MMFWHLIDYCRTHPVYHYFYTYFFRYFLDQEVGHFVAILNGMLSTFTIGFLTLYAMKHKHLHLLWQKVAKQSANGRKTRLCLTLAPISLWRPSQFGVQRCRRQPKIIKNCMVERKKNPFEKRSMDSYKSSTFFSEEKIDRKLTDSCICSGVVVLLRCTGWGLRSWNTNLIKNKRRFVAIALRRLKEELSKDENEAKINGRKYIVSLKFDELEEKLQKGDITAEQTVDAYLSKAIEINEIYNCVTEFVKDSLDNARNLDARYKGKMKPPLFGIPFSVKDNFHMQGYDSTIGLAKHVEDPKTDTASLVVHLKSLGAIPIWCVWLFITRHALHSPHHYNHNFLAIHVARLAQLDSASALYEGRGFESLNECYFYDAPASRAPNTVADVACPNLRGPCVRKKRSVMGSKTLGDGLESSILCIQLQVLGRLILIHCVNFSTVGGSSGGEACIIAAGGCPFGIGSDIGGSLRIPAHFCGVVSLKPSESRLTVSNVDRGVDGCVRLGLSYGFFTRDVKTQNLLWSLTLTEEYFSKNPYTIPMPFRNELTQPNSSNSKGKIGYYVDDVSTCTSVYDRKDETL
uniref:Amidase domain-containing protein n=1 Tax=Romanomermis culicivorax TaxID=13658 RepID=A0A915JVP0_ROMCU